MGHVVSIHYILSLFVILVLGTGRALAAEEPPAFVSTRTLSMTTALSIVEKAQQACTKMGYQVAVAVSDRYGNLLAFARDPLAGTHTIQVAQDKAYTAASFQSPTLGLSQRLQALANTPRVLLVGGGIPIRVGGYFYGAVGVSGAPMEKVAGDIDERCANAGIDAVRDSLEFS